MWVDAASSDPTDRLCRHTQAFLLSPGKIPGRGFLCRNFLGSEGMSVFTAMVGMWLSYRDHSCHGNQGWHMVLSRPLHILEHWELVWKFSSLKNKDVTNSIFYVQRSLRVFLKPAYAAGIQTTGINAIYRLFKKEIPLCVADWVTACHSVHFFVWHYVY